MWDNVWGEWAGHKAVTQSREAKYTIAFIAQLLDGHCLHLFGEYLREQNNLVADPQMTQGNRSLRDCKLKFLYSWDMIGYGVRTVESRGGGSVYT